MALVNPPNWVLAFVGQNGSLTSPSVRFLQGIVNALNGTSVSGVSSVVLGNGQTWSSGAGSPNGAVGGNIGDLYSNASGGSGTTLWVKESGTSGSNTGWVGL